MFVSKLLPLTSVARLGLRSGFKNFSTTVARKGGHGHWTYRTKEGPPDFNVKFANCCGAFMWWWIWWHIFSDYGHLVGHFEFVSPKTWTDAELGVPPDDAEDP